MFYTERLKVVKVQMNNSIMALQHWHRTAKNKASPVISYEFTSYHVVNILHYDKQDIAHDITQIHFLSAFFFYLQPT